jgi:hypothetical protein
VGGEKVMKTFCLVYNNEQESFEILNQRPFNPYYLMVDRHPNIEMLKQFIIEHYYFDKELCESMDIKYTPIDDIIARICQSWNFYIKRYNYYLKLKDKNNE